MANKVIRIGDRLTARIGQEVVTGKVKDIERVQPGEKYGEQVDEADVTELHRYVFDLDCKRFVYGRQVISR